MSKNSGITIWGGWKLKTNKQKLPDKYAVHICCGIASDGFISLVRRWGRDVHCIVGVLRRLTTRHDLIIACKRGGQVSQCVFKEKSEHT